MSLETLGSDLGIYAGTFVVCLVSAVVPLVNAELWLVALTLLLRNAAPLPAVVVLAAAGQMVGKSLLYFTAQGALDLPTGRYRAKVEKARATIARWKKRPMLLLFASASVGVPPLYVTTLFAGGLGYRFRSFFAIGMLGRAVRFAVIVTLAWTGAS